MMNQTYGTGTPYRSSAEYESAVYNHRYRGGPLPGSFPRTDDRSVDIWRGKVDWTKRIVTDKVYLGTWTVAELQRDRPDWLPYLEPSSDTFYQDFFLTLYRFGGTDHAAGSPNPNKPF